MHLPHKAAVTVTLVLARVVPELTNVEDSAHGCLSLCMPCCLRLTFVRGGIALLCEETPVT
jgi:hypothetical protein